MNALGFTWRRVLNRDRIRVAAKLQYYCIGVWSRRQKSGVAMAAPAAPPPTPLWHIGILSNQRAICILVVTPLTVAEF